MRTQNAPYAYHGLDQLVKKDPPTLETTNQKQWDSWVSRIENLFLVMNAMTDHPRRTRWAIQGFKKDAALQSEVNRRLNACETDGNEVTWLELKQIVQDFIRDPAVRRFEIANKYYTSTMCDTQKFDTFLNHMLTYEGLLSHKPHAEDDDAQKIDFWFTRLTPQLQRKLLQQNLSEKAKTFNEFCTQVRYCEQLDETTGTHPEPSSSKRRRDTDSGPGGKRKDGKTHPDRSSGNNSGSANQGSQTPGSDKNAPFSHPNRNRNGGGWNRGQAGGNKPKDHWKQNGKGQQQGSGSNSEN
jgi:hypothetical protein